MHFREYKLKGEFTVEAAVLIPISFFVIIFLIFADFAGFDAVTSYGQAYRGALYAASTPNAGNEEKTNLAAAMYRREALKTRAAIREEETSVEAAGTEVTVKYSYQIYSPFPKLWEEWLGISAFQVESEAKVLATDPVVTLLEARALQEKVDSILSDRIISKGENHMLYAEYRKEIDGIRLLLPDRNPTEEDYQYEMLSQNRLKDFFPVQRQFQNGIGSYVYELGVYQPLSLLYENREISYEVLRRLMISIKTAMEEVGEYLLDENGVVLDADYIYADEECREFFFVFYPPLSGTEDYRDYFRKLSEFVVEHVERHDESAVDLAYEIFKEARSSRFTIHNVLARIESRDEEEARVSRERRKLAASISVEEENSPEAEPDFEVQESGTDKKGALIVIALGIFAFFLLVGNIYVNKECVPDTLDYILGAVFLSVPLCGILFGRRAVH